jgi:hypothetical protein
MGIMAEAEPNIAKQHAKAPVASVSWSVLPVAMTVVFVGNEWSTAVADME